MWCRNYQAFIPHLAQSQASPRKTVTLDGTTLGLQAHLAFDCLNVHAPLITLKVVPLELFSKTDCRTEKTRVGRDPADFLVSPLY